MRGWGVETQKIPIYSFKLIILEKSGVPDQIRGDGGVVGLILWETTSFFWVAGFVSGNRHYIPIDQGLSKPAAINLLWNPYVYDN